MSVSRWWLTLLLLTMASIATAQTDYAADAAAMSKLSLARVSKAAKTYLLHGKDRAGCPANSVRCRRAAYLVTGDPVLIDASAGAFVSVNYVAASGTMTQGWLPATAVTRVAPLPPGSAAWRGNWQRDEASIDIKPTKRPGRLNIDGTASWGTHDPERVERGGIHTGELNGEATPVGDRLSITDGPDGCAAWLRLVGPYLVVTDNLQCGGVNVSFSGIYRRSR
ncbi:hypothetical protein ACVWZA_000393 [Sphingomonas sp. UYAg733]